MSSVRWVTSQNIKQSAMQSKPYKTYPDLYAVPVIVVEHERWLFYSTVSLALPPSSFVSAAFNPSDQPPNL